MKQRVAVALLLLSVFLGGTASPSTSTPNTSPVIIIFMENAERSEIEASADADYFKAFEASGISFTQYFGVTHPSLPNYIAVAAGDPRGKTGSDTITAGEIRGANLWAQMSRNHLAWGVYEEDMPSVCYSGVSTGLYRLRHNPATVFYNIYNRPKRCANVKPYTSFDVNALPAVSFITPNMCNDMHDCSIATGDNWLAARVPAMLAVGATVIITFDEGDSGAGGGGNIYMAVNGPGITHSVITSPYNHYSLLAAIENRLELPLLRKAKTAVPLPIG